MTVLLGGVHVQKNVFSLRLSDSRFAAVLIALTRVRRQQGCTRIHTPTLKLCTTWNILAIRAPLVSSTHEVSLQHHLPVTFYGITQLRTKDSCYYWTQLLCHLCAWILLLRSVSTSTGKGNGSTSLKNVTHNGLLCYCRSTQELPVLTARIWHSLTARCWTEKKFFVVPATFIKSRV